MDGKKINENCPCVSQCVRHGDCAACQANHKGGLTACQKEKK